MADSAPSLRIAALTAAAMAAFAGNSLLCRLALDSGAIDAGSFTAVRLAAGAVTLLLLAARGQGAAPRRHGSAVSALMLFAYAALFSFAYITLDAATGALLLFGFVQATIVIAALLGGDRPRLAEWAGWLAAAAGLAWLLLPGATAPDPLGAALMAGAGIAWGVYTLRGRGSDAPLPATAANFTLALVCLPLLLPFTLAPEASARGIALAVLSGAVTSGLGYVLWYAALAGLGRLQAALVQLSVPPLTAVGGTLLLGELLHGRLLASGALILGGIALALSAGARPAHR